MLSDLGNDLKNILLAGIGAVAVTAEKADEVIKELVKKGEITLEQGKALNEELKHRVKKTPSTSNAGMDVEQMTPDERAELKRKLEELDKQDGEKAEK